MIRPIYVLLDGRATKQFDGVIVPTDAIAVEAAHTYLHKILPALNLTGTLSWTAALVSVRQISGTFSGPVRELPRDPTIPPSVSVMHRSRKQRLS